MSLRSFQVLVNYWELKPSQYTQVFDKLLQQGLDEVVSYIPWQHFESDVTHLLMKFISSAVERGVRVRLIITPDLGFDHTYSGLPKDLLAKEDVFAQFSNFEKMVCFSPPRSFSIPSHFSEEFTKRYYNFLTRFNSFFGVLDKLQIPLQDTVEVLFAGGFWKYYRSPEDAALSPFSGACLDYSKNSTLSYRKYLESFYSQEEFSYPHPGSATRWKTKAYEEVNRKMHHATSESFFRQKTEEVIRKKSLPIKTEHIELYSPEVDPSLFYSEVLRSLVDGVSDFHKLSLLIEEYGSRLSSFSDKSIPPYIHWSFFPGVKMLSESEKQFLLLKSLLMAGSKGGAVIVDYREWLQFSPAFRKKCESLSRSISEQDLFSPAFACYLTTQLWSQAHPLWFHLKKQLPYFSQMISRGADIQEMKECQLLVIDPGYLLTKSELEKLLAWAQEGGMLVLPKNKNLSGAAQELFDETFVDFSQTLDVHLGVNYQVHTFATGKVIAYETGSAQAGIEFLDSWKKFVAALLKMNGLEKICRLSDNRVSALPVLYRDQSLSHRYVLFLLNDQQRSLQVETSFTSKVKIKDFTSNQKGQNHGAGSIDSQSYTLINLDIPACGIVSLSVEATETQYFEKFFIHKENLLDKVILHKMSFSELPGLDIEGHI